MSLTDKQLAGNQRRTLRKMRERLLAMAGDWDGLDGFNVSELTDLADKAESVAIGLVDTGAAEPNAFAQEGAY
jgi:hypothetical protein